MSLVTYFNLKSVSKRMRFVGRIVIGLTLVASAFPASASIIGRSLTDEKYVLAKQTIIEENFYTVAKSIIAYGEVWGDMTAAAFNLSLSGIVTDDVLFLGNIVTVSGDVGGDARLLGSVVAFSGMSGGDVVIVAGKTSITSSALVGGDALIASSDVSLQGIYGGKVKVAGNKVRIAGDIGGDVTILSSDAVIASGARIAGDLLWYGSSAPVLEEGAVVLGEIRPTTFGFSENVAPSVRGISVVVAGLVQLLSLLFLVLIVVYLLKGVAMRFGEAVETPQEFIFSLGVGVISILFIPFVSILLFFSLVGFFASVALFALFFLLLTFSLAVSGILAGVLLYRMFSRDVTEASLWRVAVTGVVVLTLVSYVPYLGLVVAFVLYCVSFGQLVRIIISTARGKRLEVPPVSGSI